MDGKSAVLLALFCVYSILKIIISQTLVFSTTLQALFNPQNHHSSTAFNRLPNVIRHNSSHEAVL